MHLVAVGGSDAGISAALRARELDPSAEVTVVVADEYPELLNLWHSLLRLGRGVGLAQSGPPNPRRPTSHWDERSIEHPCHQD